MNFLIEYCRICNKDRLDEYNRPFITSLWLIRARSIKDAKERFLEIIDTTDYEVVSVKEFDELLDTNKEILNFESYAKRYLWR